MERYEINKYLESFRVKVNDLYDALLISSKTTKLNKLDEEISSVNFWDDQKHANEVINEANSLREDISLYNKAKVKLDELEELNELSFLDDEMYELLDEEVTAYIELINETEEAALLSSEYDNSNCILELHPGAGGTESMDWASMLLRMYQRFCQRKGFKANILDYLPGDEAGIKSVTMSITGKNAYGLFKSERGVHRLVRISPFDSGARRHTSFCSCDISPVIKDNNDIIIRDDEIRIDVYHSSGAGGQSVNTTDSAVRITHLPTNIVVTCQNERSQIKNREVAMKILKSKLLEKKINEQEEKLRALKGEHMGINFGSQIRSYVFCPYTLVKDHRTGYENTNVSLVMDGDIEPFMISYLKYEKGGFKNE